MQRRRILFTLLAVLFVICVGAVSAQTTTPTPSPTPTGEYIIYRVQYGDTLGAIATRYGTTVRLLARLNNIVNVDLISIGQIIYIPTGEFRDAIVAQTATAAAAQSTEEAGATATPSEEATGITGTPGDVQVEATSTSDTSSDLATDVVATPLPLEPTLEPTVEAPVETPVEPTADVTTDGEATLDPLLQTATAMFMPQGEATLDPLFQTATAIIAGATEETPLLDATATSIDPQSAPTEVPTVEIPVLETPTEAGPPPEMGFGIELYTEPSRATSDAALVTALGGGWVKLYANWRDLEAVPGVIDYTALDAEIDALDAAGLNIILTVSTSPEWARTSQEENGPPDDLSLFADFLTELAGHYIGRVDAYEIWHEPNLRREWNSTVHTLGAGVYTQMLQSAYTAVKGADSAAQVISAGLAPTGIDDGFNAINDRRFFTELLQSGASQFADGYGVHPYGYASPPDMRCCDQPEGVETHYGDPSFYFLSLLETYRDLAAQYSPVLPLWVTAFGWGVAEPGVEVSRNFAYISYNTPDEQAAYAQQARQVAVDLGVVRVMILSNLNGCTVVSENAELCYLSVNTASFEQRPIFEALRQQAAALAPTG